VSPIGARIPSAAVEDSMLGTETPGCCLGPSFLSLSLYKSPHRSYFRQAAIAEKERDLSLLQSVHTTSEIHPASYRKDTACFHLKVKEAWP
jgi:hypothetical protein